MRKAKAFLLSCLVFVPGFAQAQDVNRYWGGGCSGMMNYFPGFAILGAIVSLIFWLLLIVGIIYLVRYLTHYHTGKDQAIETLKMRYARGEITKEEYDRMKEDLDRIK